MINIVLADRIIELTDNKRKFIRSILYRWEVIALTVPTVITAKIAIEQLIMLTRNYR